MIESTIFGAHSYTREIRFGFLNIHVEEAVETEARNHNIQAVIY